MSPRLTLVTAMVNSPTVPVSTRFLPLIWAGLPEFRTGRFGSIAVSLDDGSWLKLARAGGNCGGMTLTNGDIQVGREIPHHCQGQGSRIRSATNVSLFGVSTTAPPTLR